jgi:hypothetical protein
MNRTRGFRSALGAAVLLAMSSLAITGCGGEKATAEPAAAAPTAGLSANIHMSTKHPREVRVHREPAAEPAAPEHAPDASNPASAPSQDPAPSETVAAPDQGDSKNPSADATDSSPADSLHKQQVRRRRH